MNELKAFDGFEIINGKTGDGFAITKLIGNVGISSIQNIEWDSKTVLANNVYTDKYSYESVYSIIDSEGNGTGNYLENNGINPTLFKSPDNELYVSISPYDPDKQMEISVPLLNRALIQEPKPIKPFNGKYIGNINQSSIFYDIDSFSDKKQDKLLNIEFKNGVIKKKHNIKIDFPKNNTVFIGNNGIHLLAQEDNIHVHRQIDEFGKELKQRKIDLGRFWCRETLSLTFDGSSYIISDNNGKITLLEIDSNGKCTPNELIDIGEEIYNVWQPVEIGNNSFIIQFNTGFGNGWFAIKDNELVEFYYGKGNNGYRSLLTNKIIDMGNNDLFISGINKTENNKYAVIFYDKAKGNEKPKEIIILNMWLLG